MTFRDTLYIKISKNKITVRNVSTHSELTASDAFTSRRLLIGNFTCAQALLNKMLSQTAAKGFLKLAPVAVLHPLEMTEDGLSQIEDRIFSEIALGAGVGKVIVHLGELLDDAAVMQVLKT